MVSDTRPRHRQGRRPMGQVKRGALVKSRRVSTESPLLRFHSATFGLLVVGGGFFGHGSGPP
eukprot:scaffold5443_cov291-Pinguiococcus_pyrenoidosus.AAC.1